LPFGDSCTATYGNDIDRLSEATVSIAFRRFLHCDSLRE
jgi:hypothetical protein